MKITIEVAARDDDYNEIVIYDGSIEIPDNLIDAIAPMIFERLAVTLTNKVIVEYKAKLELPTPSENDIKAIA